MQTKILVLIIVIILMIVAGLGAAVVLYTPKAATEASASEVVSVPQTEANAAGMSAEWWTTQNGETAGGTSGGTSSGAGLTQPAAGTLPNEAQSQPTLTQPQTQPGTTQAQSRPDMTTAEATTKAYDATAPTQASGSWQAAYRENLRGIIKSENNDRIRFDLVYIDADDIPELLLSRSQIHHAPAEVLTYYNGKVVSIGSFGSGGETGYYEKQGIIYSYDSGMGVCYEGFYRMKNGKYEIMDEFEGVDNLEGLEAGNAEYDLVGGVQPFFKINGVDVSKEEYHNRLKYYNQTYGNADWRGTSYQLTQSNIDTYIR